MGQLIVTRDPTVWVDRKRAYWVVVDGEKLAKLAHGETMTIDLAPGAHTVRMAIDWCRSKSITVDGARDTRLVARAGTTATTAIFYAVFARDRYILLDAVEPRFNPPSPADPPATS